MSDMEQMSNYLFGLNQNIQKLVRVKGPKTLSDALREARILDTTNNKERISINYIKQVNGPIVKNQDILLFII